jgi:hypothetical protein
MDIFVRNTNNSAVEVCEQSLRWQYGEADPEFGHMQSKELEETLQEMSLRNDVCVTRGSNRSQKYIEARSKGVSKAVFLGSLLQTLWSMDVDIDFVLAVGDDESDESLFEAANQLPLPRVCFNESAIFTAVVGRRQSNANVCVESVSELMRIFRRLGRSLRREKRNFSTSDLHGLTISKRRAKLLDLESSSFTRFVEKQQATGGTPQTGGGGGGGGIAQALSMSLKKGSLEELMKVGGCPLRVIFGVISYKSCIQGSGPHRRVFLVGEEGGSKDDNPQQWTGSEICIAQAPMSRSVEEYMNRSVCLKV